MESTVDWLALAFDRVVGFFPNLIAGLLILVLGYVIGVVLAKLTRSVAHRLGFDRFVRRLGLPEPRSGKAPSYFLGSAVLFVVAIATLMQASRAWNLSFVAVGLARFLAYLPHVLAAAVVFAVALFLGNWARDQLSRTGREPDREARRTDLLPSAVRGGILAVGAFMALRELQIAPEIVNAAFILTLAAVALAGALAFGLGGREVAGRIAQSWYERRGELRLGRPRVIAVQAPAEAR